MPLVSARFMFQVNAFVTLASGLVYLLAPELNSLTPVIGSSFVASPNLFGDTFSGAIQVGFGLCSWLGLKDAEKYKPVLLCQLFYKTTFLCTTAFHYVISKRFTEATTPYESFLLGLFVFFAIGNGLVLLEDAGKPKTKAL